MDKANNKTVLITGTSSGIGKAAALLFQEAGFTVFATAPEINTEMDELRAKGCEILQLDVTDEQSCRAAVAAAENVNGAISVDDIRHNFEVIVFGLIRLCQLVLPGMRRAGTGRIVNVSSVAGEVNEPGSGIYHATKHAVEAIDQTLRMEVSGFGIEVVGVLPGPVSTNFAETAIAQIPDTGADSPYFIFKQNLAKATRELLSPDKTATLTPEEVAETIVKAATVENPATNYHVGAMSKVMSAVVGLVPDKIWDAAMKRQIPSDKKI
jgi:short-subunit dehydrogenase